MAQSSLHIGLFKDPLDTHLPFFGIGKPSILTLTGWWFQPI